MNSRKPDDVPAAIAREARPLEEDFQEIVDLADGADIVLIGEASHGTHEFYRVRERITRRLIAEKGYRTVALEADWPDALRVHRHVTGGGADRTAEEALGDFRRFPVWMWRNGVTADFVEWLREWNAGREGGRAGIFGMDLYSMHRSMDAVLEYLEKTDTEAARRARGRYGCFEDFGDDPQAYGYATASGAAEPCEADVVAQLVELHKRRADLARRDGRSAADEHFFAERNAALVVNAERYYRAMFRGRNSSWNLRDGHMADTLAALAGHLGGEDGKLVVWAHNSHLGDARATGMGARGEWNVGQLMRERFPGRVRNIGFTTYAGTVTAARDWGGPAERRRVRPALEGSCEALFHGTGRGDFWLDLRRDNAATEALRRGYLQRAIGVIYRPETERWSHYFEASVPDQFDALIHLDGTRALEPLERNSEWLEEELPETYPSGL